MFWSNYFANPQSIYVKKYLHELLKDKYLENEKFIERITNQLGMEEDVKAFVKLSGDLFQKGYVLSLEQHKEALAKVGMSVKVTGPSTGEQSVIFSQKNRDDPARG